MSRVVYIGQMSRKYAANNIRQLRKERGFTMEKLALAIAPDVSLTTIQKLENGSMGLSLDWMLKLAEALGVSVHDIISEEAGFRMLPVLGSIAASDFAEALETPERYIPVPGDNLTGREFVLRVDGDSMDHIVANGGYVVVDPDRVQLVDGKPYAIRNEFGETTFKRYSANPPQLEPMSTNAAHQPILVGASPFTVIGRIVRTLQEFE